MYYGMIKKTDIANGSGVRVTLFVSGCRHRCEGCFQPETRNFTYGQEYTKETEEEVLDALANPFVKGLTLLGGEPFEPENQRVLVPLLRRVKERFPEKTVWSYSGYTLENDLWGRDPDPNIPPCRCEVTDEMLSYLDVLVDGEFVMAKKDLRLKFRGSSNQRLIDVKATLKKGEVVELEL
ncbi:MAG: anaerobic ribonucleoside-triphosphate reductase activating protein [Lachnospiraceae bacterium]|nr:anaerobic ribonucleoside-triphosphate reductase activating protein [Lachnospiraceae bacterium]